MFLGENPYISYIYKEKDRKDDCKFNEILSNPYAFQGEIQLFKMSIFKEF